jgi:multicomponent Na+:H+ antiporter subunit F
MIFEDYFNLVIIAIISLGILLGFVRFVIGPTASDRVVALDIISILAIAFMVFMSHVFGRFIYVDVALVYAVLGFIGVLAFARYLEGGV